MFAYFMLIYNSGILALKNVCNSQQYCFIGPCVNKSLNLFHQQMGTIIEFILQSHCEDYVSNTYKAPTLIPS